MTITVTRPRRLFIRSTAAILTLLAMFGVSSTTMSQPNSKTQTVLVVGATGKTGRLIVNDLLADGYTVRALVRDTTKARNTLPTEAQIVEGDVKDPASLTTAVKGTDAIISAIGASTPTGPNRPETIDYLGVKNLVDAAVSAKSQQFVLVSSRSVTQIDNPLNKMFGNVLIWKLMGEDTLRASGIPYTVVRPGGLTDKAGGEQELVFEQGDAGGSSTVTRADVARITVEALKHPEARDRTFEVGARPGTPVTNWAKQFGTLKPDPSP